MDSFEEVYRQLNDAQKQAVDTVDGPVLVIAGPGTGKTQLLSARVANILRVTDTPAQNILCLTFTENGADNMRERLSRFIGQAAYEVNIGTYHAFGGDLIRRYPEYFMATRMQNPVDDLGKREILAAITENMSYSNPLKQTRHHLGDLMSTISEVKRALLTPDQLRAIARENLRFIHETAPQLQEIFDSFTTMPRAISKALPYFEQILTLISSYAKPEEPGSPYGSLAGIAAAELAGAVAAAAETSKTSPLTTWKNDWLEKDENNHLVIAGELENLRVRALATVLEEYETALAERDFYDFDDMILRSIHALETHKDLRYSLQEKYLYVLLDEFQDTNAAQLKLIELLTDNPVHEGRPNVMAVGDDDQAIYAFQGAQYSNMRDFYGMYRGVRVINLTENYRSHAAILETAGNIAAQIENRLETSFDIKKDLTAAHKNIAEATVERRDFLSAIAERHWIAGHIKKLLDDGTPAHEIAVLAPKHKYIEPLVPYLNELGVPVRYEKRENILDAAVVRQLITMSRLVLALEADNQPQANHLWPQVLSYDFWELPIGSIWKLAWQVSDSAGTGEKITWSTALLAAPEFRVPATLLLTLAAKAHTETLETLLDYLIGNTPVTTHDPTVPSVVSPLRAFYMSPAMQKKQPELFYETVSHITVLRARLKDYQRTADSTLNLRDFIRYIALYEEAEQQMINTSPYSQQADAVQLMTVFKAKGLEFSHVFIPDAADDVWGSSARDNSNKLTLPANLRPIRHAGVSDDERLRILFVAITRAKQGVYLTSARQTYAGKPIKRLKYLDEIEQSDNSFRAMVLPPTHQKITMDDTAAPGLELLEIDWRARHLDAMSDIDMKGLLARRLQKYQVSPTHLTDFLDLEYGGPEYVFFKTILRFPEPPLPDAQFGNAIHETLHWVQLRVSEQGAVPPVRDVTAYFKSRMISKHLTEQRTALEIERGEKALGVWLQKRAHIFKPSDVAEKNFHNEGVFIDGNVHMSGRIDRLEIDPEARTITVVDYKTGKSHERWASDPKLYRYRLQLLCYKLLLEHSATYRSYKVTAGRLEFIEPDSKGQLHNLELQFTASEVAQAEQLLVALWNHIHELKFPDISQYPVSLTGMKAFVSDLLDGSI